MDSAVAANQEPMTTMELSMDKIMSMWQEGTVKEYSDEFQFLFNQVKNSEEMSEYYAIYLFMNGLKPKIRDVFITWHQYSCIKVEDVISLALKIDSNDLQDSFSPFDPNSSFYNENLKFDINIPLNELMKDNELFRIGMIQETCDNIVHETIVDEVIVNDVLEENGYDNMVAFKVFDEMPIENKIDSLFQDCSIQDPCDGEDLKDGENYKETTDGDDAKEYDENNKNEHIHIDFCDNDTEVNIDHEKKPENQQSIRYRLVSVAIFDDVNRDVGCKLEQINKKEQGNEPASGVILDDVNMGGKFEAIQHEMIKKESDLWVLHNVTCRRLLKMKAMMYMWHKWKDFNILKKVQKAIEGSIDDVKLMRRSLDECRLLRRKTKAVQLRQRNYGLLIRNVSANGTKVTKEAGSTTGNWLSIGSRPATRDEEEGYEEYGSPIVLSAEVADTIKTRTEELLKKTKTAVSSKPIMMRAEYAHCPNLTIIDTPGFVLRAKKGESESTPEEILSMVISLASPPNRILLFLQQSSAEWCLSLWLDVIRDIDPTFRRTLIVVSKFDNRLKEFTECWEVDCYLSASGYLGVKPHPFLVGLPKERDAVSNDKLRRQISQVDSDVIRHLKKNVKGGYDEETYKSHIGFGRLRDYLEYELQTRYKEAAPATLALLEQRCSEVTDQLNITDSKIRSTSDMAHLRRSSMLFASSICKNQCKQLVQQHLDSVTRPYSQVRYLTDLLFGSGPNLSFSHQTSCFWISDQGNIPPTNNNNNSKKKAMVHMWHKWKSKLLLFNSVMSEGLIQDESD